MANNGELLSALQVYVWFPVLILLVVLSGLQLVRAGGNRDFLDFITRKRQRQFDQEISECREELQRRAQERCDELRAVAAAGNSKLDAKLSDRESVVQQLRQNIDAHQTPSPYPEASPVTKALTAHLRVQQQALDRALQHCTELRQRKQAVQEQLESGIPMIESRYQQRQQALAQDAPSIQAALSSHTVITEVQEEAAVRPTLSLLISTCNTGKKAEADCRVQV